MIKVVILRPVLQAQRLAQCVTRMGAIPIILPMIEIIPISFSQTQIQSGIALLEEADLVQVITANAIDCAPQEFLIALKKPKIITMGQATTQAVQAKNIPVYFTPEPGATSESLLEQPFLQQVQGKKIVLLTGEIGRTLIEETLVARGAKVDVLKVYRQQKPVLNLSDFYQICRQDELRYVFVATSLAIIENLLSLTDEENKGWLKQQPMIVISQRLFDQATQFGFQRVHLALGAHEEAIMHCFNSLV